MLSLALVIVAHRANKCNTYPLWKGLSDEINNYLDNRKLSDYL